MFQELDEKIKIAEKVILNNSVISSFYLKV